MAARESALTYALAAVLLAGAAGCSAPNGAVPEVGDAAPVQWADDGSGRPLVAWIMRGEDYLGCQTAAGDLRRLQRRYGDRLRLSLVYVGENPEWVAGFVRRERIAAHIDYLSRAEFGKIYGRARLPAFFVTDRGKVTARALSPDGRIPPPNSRVIVENAVLAAMAGKGIPSWSGGSTSTQSNRRKP